MKEIIAKLVETTNYQRFYELYEPMSILYENLKNARKGWIQNTNVLFVQMDAILFAFQMHLLILKDLYLLAKSLRQDMVALAFI